MHFAISSADLHVLLHEADRAARRFLWKLRLPASDLDDIRQELLVDLISRVRGFDPERGSLGAFANIVLSNRATELATKIKRARSVFGAVPISLDEPVPGCPGITRGDTFSEDEGVAALWGQSVDPFTAAERRIDVARGVNRLDAGEQTLCAALTEANIPDLAASGHGSRTGLYRQLKELRYALTAFGLQPA
jgi:DNA-directed RNA polymerase specialized sigma24 family protein